MTKADKISRRKKEGSLELFKASMDSSYEPLTHYAWSQRHCQIKDPSGKVYFELKNVHAPLNWSQLAVDIAAAKYFRKKGVPKTGSEISIMQMIDRVATAIAGATKKQKFLGSKEAHGLHKELNKILIEQEGSFNSPVWFNAGLFEAYGLESFKMPQVSACFIQSIEDNLQSIFQLLKTEALLFKYGSGSGTNFSNLRSKYEELEGGGTSSGLISFLEVFDRGAGSIKSGGTTRRAAKMVIVNVDHPEIEEFIHWKEREEKKAAALIQAGYSPGIDGEAYRTVSGQNSNNSVRVTDDFIRAVREDRLWQLRGRGKKGRPLRELPARQLWRSIAAAAWACADPGLQFHDTINRMNTVKKSGIIEASNPCSEFMFLNETACNLASLNLIRFWNANTATFDWPRFDHVCRSLFLSQEALIDYAGYPTEQIRNMSVQFRPLGLGFAGLGALLMRMGIPYDSSEARAWTSAITSRMTGVAYEMSCRLAAVRGPFAHYRTNKSSVLDVLSKHARSLKGVDWSLLPDDCKTETLALWQSVLKSASKHGVRNAQATLIAPTGTIGLVMDSDTTGIEPDYSLLKIKKLAGGGELQIVSSSLPFGLRRLGYSDSQVNAIEQHVLKFGSILNAPVISDTHREVFFTAQELSSDSHLHMMAAAQPFLSGAISKTVNLPKSASIEDVEQVHMKAWEMGLKSVAIYRDGSKQFQPLLSNPKCSDCGGITELVGSCWRCSRCGFVMGCA